MSGALALAGDLPRLTQVRRAGTMPVKKIVTIHEAKAHLSRLCGIAAGGLDVVVARHGRPWVRITTLAPATRPVRFGVMKGEIRIADDFDGPLAGDLQHAFDGVQ